MTTAEKMKKIRLTLGMTQREFAIFTGLKHSTICCYETNRRKPNFKSIGMIRAACETKGYSFTIDDIRTT